MEGYLEAYGAGDEQRERRIKRIVIWGLVAVITGGSLYFIFHTWRQEQVVKQFFSLLEQKNYQAAYALWCPDHPCKYYAPDKFIEDWGPSSAFADPAAAKVAHVDSCGTGVRFDVEHPKAGELGLYVDRDTNLIGFAPEPRCPGRHLQLIEFLRARFG